MASQLINKTQNFAKTKKDQRNNNTKIKGIFLNSSEKQRLKKMAA